MNKNIVINAGSVSEQEKREILHRICCGGCEGFENDPYCQELNGSHGCDSLIKVCALCKEAEKAGAGAHVMYVPNTRETAESMRPRCHECTHCAGHDYCYRKDYRA